MASPANSQHSSSVHSGVSHRSGSIRSGSSRSSERDPTGYTIADALSVEEYGRHFNAYREGKYLLPNDGDEQDRLDLQHKLWLLILNGKLSIAPIGEPKNALDIGTGTGIWAKKFAREHPTTHVVGTDLSLIQPEVNMPPNLQFEREDSEEMWVFDYPFDFIHWRLMCTCFNDMRGMFTRVYEHLVPGGWVELHDAEFVVQGEDEKASAYLQHTPYQRWFQTMVAGGAALGRDLTTANKFRGWMIEAGFVDVVEKVVLVPVNGWPINSRDSWLGKWFSLDVLRFLDSSRKLLLAGGIPAEQIDGFLEDVRHSSLDPRLRAYVPHYIVYGRKPHTIVSGVRSHHR
ncbi:unnamed protein product [Discula destructiva]